MNGFPHLARHHGTKMWCYENMVDIFENPRGHNLGCILGEPFKVARSFRHGEKFRWEEFEFEMTHSPGHTEYQMALFVTVDGRRVAFTGDAFFLPNPKNDGTLRHNLIFRNHVENDSHLKSIRNLIEHEPQMICPGPRQVLSGGPANDAGDRAEVPPAAAAFRELLPEGEIELRARSELGEDLPVPDAADARHGTDAADPGAELQPHADEAGSGAGGARRVADLPGYCPYGDSRGGFRITAG